MQVACFGDLHESGSLLSPLAHAHALALSVGGLEASPRHDQNESYTLLYFFPLPHGHGAFLEVLAWIFFGTSISKKPKPM